MKKKAAMVAITISMLLLSLVGLRFVEVAEANPITFPKQPPVITVYSPATGQTYNTSEIPLTATINVFNAIVRKIEMVSWLNYTLDGQPSASLTVIMPLDFGPGYTATINATLTGLSDGAHILEIYGQTTFNQSTYANTTFIVDTYSLESPTSTQSPSIRRAR